MSSVMNVMKHKGYAARIEYSDEDACFIGRLEGIRDVIGFHAETVDGLRAALQAVAFAELCITSGVAIVAGEGPADAFRLPDVKGVAVVIEKAPGVKCARSWKYFDPSTADKRYPDIPPRDAEAVAAWDAARG